MKIEVIKCQCQKMRERLNALGATVFDWDKEKGYGDHVGFVMVWANDDSSEVIACRS